MRRIAIATLWLTLAVALGCLTITVTRFRPVNTTQIGEVLGKDNLTVTEAVTEDDFNQFFPHKDTPALAHAIGFYTYESFLAAASMFQEEGFGLKGGSVVQRRELAAFLAHAAHGTTCGWSKSIDGPYAWGLCYNQELAPSSIYCTPDVRYPCVNGVSYHGRGVFPVYYNYNYGTVGNALKLNFLTNPGLVASNATLAFATAMWIWMTPQKPNPSPHSIMANEWKPLKTDVDSFRKPGFGMTINTIAPDECGHGEDDKANDRISHYMRFISQILSVDPGDNIDCGTQGMLPTGFTAVL